METIEYKGFNIIIEQDETPENPRDWDNIGTMACYHPRYHLGDPQFHECKNSEETMFKVLEDILDTDKANALYNAWPNHFIDKAIFIMKKLCPVVMPLYILDHSGIWMKTSRFMEDPGGWDTSLVGFIYVTKEKIKEEYGNDEKAIDKTINYVENEIKYYSDFLSGACYGYRIKQTDSNTTISYDESCWGFFELDRDYMIEEAKYAIDYAIKTHRQETRARIAERKELNAFMRIHWAL